jgi:hypothetical protein
MDTDSEEQTLFEVTEKDSNPIEKPKRVATQRQLDALAHAREVRAAQKQQERDEAAQETPKPKKEIVVHDVPKPKPKKKPKPTVIQFQDETDSDEDDAPVIIIKNKKSKPKPAPEPVPVPVPVPTPVEEKPRQYIRKAY